MSDGCQPVAGNDHTIGVIEAMTVVPCGIDATSKFRVIAAQSGRKCL